MTQTPRGDRYWSKKNAFATISLVHRVSSLVTVIRTNSAAGTGAAQVQDDERLLDEEINAAEAEARKLMDRMAKDGRKKEFDKRVHGQP